MILPSVWGGVIVTVKMLGCAVLAAVVAVSAAEARSVAQIGGPANPPPASYKGQQFVDSRGCLFLRAGSGRNVNWVSRIDAKRKPICGMLPTGSPAAQAAVVADMAPDALARPQQGTPASVVAAPVLAAPIRPVAAAASAPQANTGTGMTGAFSQKPSAGPAPTVFSSAQPTTPAKPVAPGPSYQGTFVATSVAGVQCYGSAPRLERVKLSGGTTLVCTRGDGTTAGWRAPLMTASAKAQIATQTTPVMQTASAAPVQYAAAPVRAPVIAVPAPVVAQPVYVAAPVYAAPPVYAALPVYAAKPVYVALAAPVTRAAVIPKPPKGWILAWKDDRLNPLRGKGTALGEAQQDQVWQRSVPMVLVSDPLPKQRGVGGLFGMRVKVAPDPYQ